MLHLFPKNHRKIYITNKIHFYVFSYVDRLTHGASYSWSQTSGHTTDRDGLGCDFALSTSKGRRIVKTGNFNLKLMVASTFVANQVIMAKREHRPQFCLWISMMEAIFSLHPKVITACRFITSGRVSIRKHFSVRNMVWDTQCFLTLPDVSFIQVQS